MKLKTLTKKVGTKRSAQIMCKMFEENIAGEEDSQFRATLNNNEQKLLDKYEEAYVSLMLRRAAAMLWGCVWKN